MSQKDFEQIKYPLMKNNFNKDDFKSIISLLKSKDPKLTQGQSVKNFENNGLNG